jgi:hypothetical protein
MNKIKNSFSKIKVSNEFKDKLERELLSNQIKSKMSSSKIIYYRPSIVAASILLILFGIISFRSIENKFINGNSNLKNIAYSPKEDLPIDNDFIQENNQNGYTNYNNEQKKDTLPKQDDRNIKSINNDDTLSGIKEENSSSRIKMSSEKGDINKGTISSSSNDVVNSSEEAIHSSNVTEDKNNNLVTTNISMNSVYVPKIQLPETQLFKTAKGMTAKMMPLIIYKGQVYVYAPIKIDSEDLKNLLGRKLGKTKNDLNEWSTENNYSKEFASNIGVTDVYAVNGYDEDFRIMTNVTLEDGTNYPEIYECINGITIKNGADFFGKLKLQGNIINAKFQNFSDWNNGTGNFYSIDNLELLNNLVQELNKATPYLPEDVEATLGDYRTNDKCKQIYLDLKDGCKNITMTILKDGYVYYGYPRVYFKIDENFSKKLWDKLGIMSIN